MNGSLNMAFIVLHKRSAVNDDRALVGQVGFAAFYYLLGQVIRIDDLNVGERFGSARHWAANSTGWA